MGSVELVSDSTSSVAPADDMMACIHSHVLCESQGRIQRLAHVKSRRFEACHFACFGFSLTRGLHRYENVHIVLS